MKIDLKCLPNIFYNSFQNVTFSRHIVKLFECLRSIRNNRELYDANHKMHRDIAFKDSIWNDISIDIGKSGKGYYNNNYTTY